MMPSGRSRLRWQNNFRMELKEIRCEENVDCIQLPRYRDQ
jgi:hypothetical protein